MNIDLLMIHTRYHILDELYSSLDNQNETLRWDQTWDQRNGRLEMITLINTDWFA